MESNESVKEHMVVHIVYHDEIQVMCDFDYNIQIFGRVMGPFCENRGLLITVVIVLV